jgi:hypothetical protein
VRPRRWSHRGVVLARGFALGAGLLSEPEIARRLLALWAPGVQVYRTGRFWIALLAEPVLVACNEAIGEPLVRVAGVLSAVPLAPDQASQLAGAALVLADAGRIDAIGQAELEPVDLSTWLDADWECVPGSPLGDPPAAPQPIAPAAIDPHAALGVPPAAPEREAVLAEIARRERGRSGAPDGSQPGLLSWLRSWWRSTAGARGTSGRAAGRGAGGPAASGTGAWARLRRWLSGALARSRLGLALGRRQARYLAELQDLFARGDVDEALRRALPTTTRAGDAHRLAFGLPGTRSSLELRLKRPEGRAGVMLVGGNWFDTLRETYARTARQLAAQGRIPEAAFVLLELLDDPEDCVRLLEEHGFVRRAAQIAEARELAPGLTVRLWFLAGEHERAVAVARRTGAFADAVARLDRTHPREAAALRMLWADSAADAGDYGAAVSIAWQVDEARHLVDVWMDRAIAAGGIGGAAMLGRLLDRHPDRLPSVAARLVELAEPTRREERLALAAGLVQNPGDAGRVVARPLLRALVRDAAERPEQRVRDALARVSRLEGGLVRADLPSLMGLEASADGAEASPIALVLEAIDTGPLDIRQAVPLPDRRVLLALGELGAALIDRHGVMVHRFAPPCEELVVADSGLRALALCTRSRTTVVHKLDLETRRSAPWGELDGMMTFAPSYDGSIWFAATSQELWGFDAQADRMLSLWHIGGVRAGMLSRSRDRLLVVTGLYDPDPNGRELWHYELPGPVLRRRQPWRPTNKESIPADIAVDGRSVEVSMTEEGPLRALLVAADPTRAVEIPVGKSRFHARGVAVAAERDTEVTIHLLDDDGRARAKIELRGSTRVSFGIAERAIAFADDRGRVLVIAGDGREILANLRPELPGRRARRS